MASISVTRVAVLDNPSTFKADFKFEVTFECIAPITDDLEWKVVYVGSASSSRYDQELDAVLVGPVPVGVSKFILQTPHPDPAKIPDDDIVGATVIMIQCFYKNREFIRIGYYLSHEYTAELGEGALVAWGGAAHVPAARDAWAAARAAGRCAACCPPPAPAHTRTVREPHTRLPPPLSLQAKPSPSRCRSTRSGVLCSPTSPA